MKQELTEVKKLEKEMGHLVLCPVALDGGWKTGRWPKRIMEQIMEYNVFDFSAWKNNGRFEDMFHNLIDGLELFNKG